MNNYPKIYFGPMSKNIVDVLGELSKKFPMGFIPSRRQIEYDGGYVNNWKTQEFCSYVRENFPNVLICRDHAGRLQGKIMDDGMESLKSDCESGFDLIHIDPWKKYNTIDEVSIETTKMIRFCLKMNKNVKFEIGTEQAIQHYTPEELSEFLNKTKQLLSEDFSSVLYAVVQFGTAIQGTKNTGIFDRKRAQKMISVCKNFGLMSKEHNGDYLSFQEIEDRFSMGLDAINIAPEYGVFETTCLINYFVDNLKLKELDKLFNLCYNSGKWKKWLPHIPRFSTSKQISFYDYLITRVSAHYIFGSDEVLKWKENSEIDAVLKRSIENKVALLLSRIYGT